MYNINLDPVSRAAGGMFGFLPDYAELFGCEAEVVEEIPGSADLKPGERKVISDGTEGPVVEIIRRATPEVEEETVAPEAAVEASDPEGTGE